MPRLAGSSNAPMLQAPAPEARDPAQYAALWSIMDKELAQSILDTGLWDEVPVTPTQRQVAHDYILSTTPDAPKQVQIEEC